MTRFLSTFACAAGAIGWVHADAATSSDATRSPERQQPLRSILMITVDDLRVELNASYGMDMVSTPNIDRLAHEGTTFLRAMTQMAVCSPSRNSFMSGRRPDTTQVWNFVDSFRDPAVGGENWTTMPQYFKQQGYLTYGYGKLFHPGSPPNNDFPMSWTNDTFNTYYWGNGDPIGDAFACNNASSKSQNGTVFATLKEKWGSPSVCQDLNDAAALSDHDVRDQPQEDQAVEYDHRVATRALEALAHAKSEGKNFYITAGFRRPHLEWRTPQKFWNIYEGAEIDLARYQTIGENITHLAFEMNGGMGQVYTGGYQISPDGPPLPVELQQALRRGYYASVSFLDFEVGRLLDGLDELGLTNTTAVIFHSDHGWKLGEHGDWSKCTNWELDTRVPLIIRAPWITPQKQQQQQQQQQQHADAGDPPTTTTTMALTELVDLFPTAVELAGLPAVPEEEGLEGRSVVPVLEQPHADHPDRVAAFSQYPRCPQFDMKKSPEDYECLNVPKDKITRMGYSVRVADARYTQWRVWLPSLKADWTPAGLVAEELYDHTNDTGLGAESLDNFEYKNLAYDPARASQVETLTALLRKNFDHEPTQQQRQVPKNNAGGGEVVAK